MSTLFLCVLVETLPLLAGIALQAWATLCPRRHGVCCLYAGATLVAGAALYDRDLTLLLGQFLALPLLWLCARSRP